MHSWWIYTGSSTHHSALSVVLQLFPSVKAFLPAGGAILHYNTVKAGQTYEPQSFCGMKSCRTSAGSYRTCKGNIPRNQETMGILALEKACHIGWHKYFSKLQALDFPTSHLSLSPPSSRGPEPAPVQNIACSLLVLLLFGSSRIHKCGTPHLDTSLCFPTSRGEW